MGFDIQSEVGIAWNILRTLTKDAVDDTHYSSELVDTHLLLNGIAEQLKNRLDIALEDWKNETDIAVQLQESNPRLTWGEIQDIISEIANIDNPVTLAAILNDPDKELTFAKRSQILQIRAIQRDRAQKLSSAHEDIWALYRVTDCHYLSGTQIVVRTSGVATE